MVSNELKGAKYVVAYLELCNGVARYRIECNQDCQLVVGSSITKRVREDECAWGIVSQVVRQS